MSRPGDWMENLQNLANIGHLLGGYSVLVTAGLNHSWVTVACAAGSLALYVGVKEFWYDLKYETGETWKSSALDTAGYVLGMALGAGALLVAGL